MPDAPFLASSQRPLRLVLVGGGHAMVELVKHAGPWTRRGIEVTLLDACDALYYSGMAPEYLGGVYTAEQVRIDLPHLCARSGVTFRRALVTALRSDGAVVTESGEEFDCDLAVFDIGGVNPHREQADGAVLTKPLHHIEALEQFVRKALEERRDTQHLVVVGGGAAGVEVLLNVSARTHATRPGALRFTLVEPSSTLLPGFPAGMQDDVQRRFARRGVDVRFGVQATGVKGGQVVLDDGTRLSADRVLWATGTAAPPLFRASDLPVDEHGFLRVDDTLQCREAPWLFAAGDCVRLSSYPDLKKIGVHAVKQGPLLRTNVEFALHALQERRPLGDLDLHAFTPYPVAPLILSTGAPTGLAAAGSLWLRGGPLLRLKHFVDRRWMAKYSPLWRDRSFLHRLGREAAVGSAPPFVS